MISINSNSAASAAAYNLNNINASLQRSLNRLSSGSRINSSMDDAGGLAVSMRLSAAIRRTEATQANVINAQSFLDTQDAVLGVANKVLLRVSELTQLATDVTKSTNDLALYQTEVNTLKAQISGMLRETFNGISLFTIGTGSSTPLTSTTLTVVTSQDGTQSVGVTQADFSSIAFVIGTIGNLQASAQTNGLVISSVTSAVASLTSVTTAIQNLAQLRAYNGAEQSRLSFAADILDISGSNLESARSRIMDVDVAAESTNLSRLGILQQAGTAMLAQANQSGQSILRLLI